MTWRDGVGKRGGVRLGRSALIASATGAALLLTACGSSGPDLGTNGQIAPVGQRVAAPDLSGTVVGGGPTSLAAMRGHVVVLNVFGSWCENCMEEQPGLSDLARDQQAKGVDFLGLAERDDDGPIKKYESTYAVPYPAVDDKTGGLIAKFRALPVSAVPATLVLDKQGREAARFIAAVLPSDLLRVIDTLNAEPA